ncbi:MAG: hypothetical protein ACR2J5_04235 [Geodermatophilaceae bacterium]
MGTPIRGISLQQAPPPSGFRHWRLVGVLGAAAVLILMLGYVATNQEPGPYQVGYEVGEELVAFAERNDRPLTSLEDALHRCDLRGGSRYNDVNERTEFHRGCIDRLQERYDFGSE